MSVELNCVSSRFEPIYRLLISRTYGMVDSQQAVTTLDSYELSYIMILLLTAKNGKYPEE